MKRYLIETYVGENGVATHEVMSELQLFGLLQMVGQKTRQHIPFPKMRVFELPNVCIIDWS